MKPVVSAEVVPAKWHISGNKLAIDNEDSLVIQAAERRSYRVVLQLLQGGASIPQTTDAC